MKLRDPMGLDIYAETLIYAYEHPENSGAISDADAKMHEENISCGDKLTIYLKIEEGQISRARFEGSGCVISMGSAEMLTDFLTGKSLAEIESMGREELLKIIGIDPGPVRMHCATLSLRATKKAIFGMQGKPVDVKTKEL